MDGVMDNSYDVTLNGLLLNGKLVPEEVVEVILSCVNLQDIPQLREVCQFWRNIVSRRMFWKKAFERNGVQWDTVPQHVRENADWRVSYLWFYEKDFLKNHSGHDGSKHWKLEGFLIVRSPPLRMDPLPENPHYNEQVDSAFVMTCHIRSYLRQKIILKEVGLTAKMMELMVPFYFVCNVMVGINFDCGCTGEYWVALKLLNENEECVKENEIDGEACSAGRWTAVNCFLDIPLECPELSQAKYLLVSIKGNAQESYCWAGHTGPKFSRISVKVTLENPNSAWLASVE